MIAKRAALSVLFVCLLIVNLPINAQHMPKEPAGRPMLPGTLPFSTQGQVGQGGMARPGQIITADVERQGGRGSLSKSGIRPFSPSGPIFYNAPSYGSGGLYALSVDVGDVNGDGKLDMVVANQCSISCASGSVSVLLGNGDGTFQPAASYGTGGVDAISVKLRDVNGDGKLDIVVANQCATNCTANGSVGVLLGNGDGTFQMAVTYGSDGQDAYDVAVADVNGDGKPDVVVSNRCATSACSTGSAVVLLGNGDGTFQTAVSYGSGGIYAFSVAVGDVNGDGKPDLVMANECAPGNCVTGGVGVLLGNGDGTFQTALSYGSGGPTAYSAAIADVNGDGKPDLVVSNQCASSTSCGSGGIGVLLGNGDGTFQTAVSYGSGGETAISVVVGDVNGDGKPDVVATNVNGNNVGILLGNGDGTFQAAVGYGSAGLYDFAAAIADVNGDGKADLLVANECTDDTCAGGSVSVLLGKGDGTFAAAPSYQTGGESASSAVTVDLNGDGKLDLVVANECDGSGTCASGSVNVLLGNGDGTFQAPVSYETGGQHTLSLALKDVNGDGKPDLVVANECADGNCTTGSVSVLLGNGDGTFQAAVTYGTGGRESWSVAITDLNGDGKPDVVVANQCVNTSCTNGSVGVLLGNGDGTFQTAVTYASGGAFALSVAAGDVNGDGKPDVVVTNQCVDTSCASIGTIGVLLGNGDGTLQPAVTYNAGGQYTTTVVLGDMNGDGKPDVVVASYYAINVLMGNGDGTFQAPVGIGAYERTTPIALALGDFDGDGKLDVVSEPSGFLLLGNGDGTLQSPIELGAFGSGIAAGDFNQDGKPDLAVAGGSVTILRNIAIFQQATTTALASSANPATYGQSVTFTATVTASGGGSPTGMVTFYDGATQVGTGTVSGNQATFTTSTLGVGSHSMTAAYSGDSHFLASGSTALNEVVQTIATTTTVASSLNPSTYGQAVTFTATVSASGGGSPTGTVTFYDGTTQIGVGAVSGNQATFTTSSLAVGTHPITAIYGGDSFFAQSTSAPLNEVVQAIVTSTTVASSLNPSTYGQWVTFTATVTTSGAAPSGTVTFTDGVNVLGAVALSGGQAALSTSGLGAGSHSIVASYSGDATHGASGSTALTQVVHQATSSVALVSSANPSFYNQAVTFAATVTPAFGGSATGTVTFYSQSGKLGTGTVIGNQATLTLNTLPVGSTPISAVYGGDANVGGSTSAVMHQVVKKAITTTSVASSLNPAFVGQTITYTATVASQYGAAVSGTVTFQAGGISLGSAALVNGQASITVSFSTSGVRSVVGKYAGDGHNLSSISPAVKQAVNRYSSSTTVVSSLNPSLAGQTVTFTATVTTGGSPTGTVTFKSGGTTLGVVALTGGNASFSTSTLTVGTHSIVAVYGGDAAVAGSTSTALSQVVKP